MAGGQFGGSRLPAGIRMNLKFSFVRLVFACPLKSFRRVAKQLVSLRAVARVSGSGSDKEMASGLSDVTHLETPQLYSIV